MTRGTVSSSVRWLSAGSVASRVLGAATSVLTARALGPDGRGQLATVLALGVLAGCVLPIGLDMWAATAMRRREGLASVRQRLRIQLGLVAALATAGTALLIVASDISVTLLVVAAGMFVASAAATMKLGLLQGLNRMAAYSTAVVSSNAVFVGSLALIVVAGSLTVSGAILCAALGQVTIALWPTGSDSTAGDSERVSTAEVLRFSIPAGAGAVATALLYRLDVLLVSAWAGAPAAGVYSVALAWTEAVWMVPTAVAQALVPHAAGSDSTLDTATLTRRTVAITTVVAVVAVASAPVALPLVFGPDYTDAVRLVLPLTLAAIAVGVWKVIGHDLMARGNAHPRLATGVVGCAVMIALDALLIPGFGTIGAAAASTAAYAVAAGGVLLAWKKLNGTPVASIVWPRREDYSYIAHRLTRRA